MAEENNKKNNKMIPFKELPVRFKVLRIVFIAVELPGLIMVIIGTALGIAGLGVLFGGLFTFMIPALVIAIIDFNLEKKYRESLEAQKDNPQPVKEEPKAIESAAQKEPELEPKQEPESAPDSWICPNCGAKVQGKFCVECGTKRPESVAEAQPVNEQVVEPEPEPEPQPEPVFKEEPVEEAPVQEPIQEEPPVNNEPKKKSKKGLIIILIIIGALVLVGGGVTAGVLISNNMKNKGNEEGPRDDDYSYIPPASSSSSKPSSSSARPSSSSAKPSSSSAQPSSSVTPSKTPKQVMEDIVTNIYGSAKYYNDNNEDYNYWYSDSGFTTIVMWDELDETYLEAAVEFVVEKLPSYLVNVDELHSGTWSDGLSGYFQNFVSQDDQVMVEVGSYYEDNALNCQILSHFNI